jgi:hypothetical protein
MQMFTKRSLIGALVGLNVVLASALVFFSYSLPAAHAQRMGASNNYVAVTCRSDNDFDVLYMLDLSERKLHCFVPDRNIASGDMKYGGARDLAKDFSR